MPLLFYVKRFIFHFSVSFQGSIQKHRFQNECGLYLHYILQNHQIIFFLNLFKGIYGKFHSYHFCLLMYYPSLCYKVSKKSSEWIPNYKVMQFWAQKSGPNLLICLKQTFFGKFHPCHFCLLIIPHYGTKFQKNPQSGFQDIRLHSFGPNLPICPKKAFIGRFHSWHFCLLIIPHYGAKFQKKILRADSKIFNKV